MTSHPFDDLPGVIVVADDDAAAAAARTAVEQAGARLLTVVSWRTALDRLAIQAAPATLLIEAAGVEGATIERLLAALVETVGAARTVVAFAAGRLDEVASALIGGEAILLCDPTHADRVAGLVMAGRAEPTGVRDNRDEAARLARINAEVARFTETLAQLTGTPQGVHNAGERAPVVGDRLLQFGHAPVEDVAVTPADLRRAIRARRLRDEVFGLPGLFEDPAWDMLLDLFAAELERRQVSVSSLCIAAGVAPTTALRWINKLIAIGLLERRPDAFDRRRAFVALTPRAASALRDYIAALRRAGLPIA